MTRLRDAPDRGRRAGGSPRDPYRDRNDDASGTGPPIFQVVALVVLVAVAFATLSLSSGRLPFAAGGNGNGAPGGIVSRTPTPSGVVVVPDDPRAKVPGTIVYAKDGNIWLQSGSSATQLTTAGTDSMPSFSADGSSVYFIRTRIQPGLWPAGDGIKHYVLTVPSVMRIAAAGGEATSLFDGLVDPAGKYVWSGWLREPVLSPDGATIALVSDLPSPDRSDVLLQLLGVKSGSLVNLHLAETQPLGHQDPAWRPDGQLLLYVRNDHDPDDTTKATPAIWAYDPATKKAKALTGPGYLHPAWSRDGRWIAATRTSAFGTDIVILDAATGAEVLKVTRDGNSWAPAWSPMGDAIAFLHLNGQVVDLRMAPLSGSGPGWTVGEGLDLTSGAGLDSVSRPSWFVPADQLPPLPTPTPSPTPSGSGGAAGSGAIGSPKPSASTK